MRERHEFEFGRQEISFRTVFLLRIRDLTNRETDLTKSKLHHGHPTPLQQGSLLTDAPHHRGPAIRSKQNEIRTKQLQTQQTHTSKRDSQPNESNRANLKMGQRLPSAQATATKRQRRRVLQSHAPNHFKGSHRPHRTPRRDLQFNGKIRRARGTFPISRLAGHVTLPVRRFCLAYPSCTAVLRNNTQNQSERTAMIEAA